ncbi:DUF3040 domain-containing protein [Yinghuangia sp. ASG 101]|uniref:DUF3040 domain-containing protein n=1 Tax=Yinghuangia sp. ASG 101 TaxID=2896848 RepID=UPI001E2DBCC8|nr:DUF3040 domain-containing protein [Yinghuangia sp. ASG 101]UGQ13319.1 DUF3040 domain-containing protein [Yinghuangia sp. ASG 101]
MSETHDKRIAELEEQFRKDDPRFARHLAAGHPYPPREYRRRGVPALAVSGLVAFVLGAVTGQGLLVAAGLVALGGATHMWAVGPRRGGHSGG